ncbi:hypothetical protein J6590_106011, partial [Homalodisca vitripennis]
SLAMTVELRSTPPFTLSSVGETETELRLFVSVRGTEKEIERDQRERDQTAKAHREKHRQQYKQQFQFEMLSHGYQIVWIQCSVSCVPFSPDGPWTLPCNIYAEAFVDINNCVQYFTSLNLTIHSSKTNVLHFSLRTAGNQCGPAILMADSTLDNVSSLRGMYLDRGLT